MPLGKLNKTIMTMILLALLWYSYCTVCDYRQKKYKRAIFNAILAGGVIGMIFVAVIRWAVRLFIY